MTFKSKIRLTLLSTTVLPIVVLFLMNLATKTTNSKSYAQIFTSFSEQIANSIDARIKDSKALLKSQFESDEKWKELLKHDDNTPGSYELEFSEKSPKWIKDVTVCHIKHPLKYSSESVCSLPQGVVQFSGKTDILIAITPKSAPETKVVALLSPAYFDKTLKSEDLNMPIKVNVHSRQRKDAKADFVSFQPLSRETKKHLTELMSSQLNLGKTELASSETAHTFSLVQPLKELDAFISVSISTRKITQGQRQLESLMIAIWFCTALVTIFLCNLVATLLVRPLEDLRLLLEAGDLPTAEKMIGRIRRSSDEIAKIARAFVKATNRLHQDNLDLKARALQRTNELERQRRAAFNLAQDAQMSQKEAEVLRAESEEQRILFEAVLASTPTGLLGLNASGEVVFVNRHCAEIFAYPEHEFMGKSIEHLVPRRFRDKHHKMVKKYLEQPSDRKMSESEELFGRRKDGSSFPIDVGLKPVYGNSKLALIAAVSDITKKKEINDELKFRTEQMRQLLYTVSHDLKVPLVTIAGFSGLIEDSVQRKQYDELPDFCLRIENAANIMRKLLEDILVVSRTGVERISYEEVDLADFFESLLQSLAGIFEDKKIDIRVSPKLPVIWADRKKLVQIFQNLIENSVKYGCPELEPRIDINYSTSDEKHFISVKDYGPGIAPSDHNRIFVLFQRANTEKDGSGIGLATALSAARRLDGTIRVESDPGKGAEFIVILKKRV